MYHYFNTKIAKEYGIESAILLEHLFFWISKNKANGKNFYDGKFWIEISVKELTELLPYMTKNKLYYAINKLIEYELVVKGNYNQSKYDRKCWYALTDKANNYYGRVD